LGSNWFGKTKNEPLPIRRIEVDSIRRVLRYEEKPAKKQKNIIQYGLIVIIAVGLLFNLGYFGTVGAAAVKSKAEALKIFKQGNYLVIFQNNAEMRPTGGFIGSFAIISFKDYKISNIDFNTNIYKLDNAFTKVTQVVPPEPLANVSQGKWSLRDSNFAVDYPTATKDIEWFYLQETGKKVDGVIAVNASLVSDLLKLTGPIYLEKYQTTITTDNFFSELTQKIEKEYFTNSANIAENEPKTILKDMMPILLEKTLKLPKYDLAKFAYDALSRKQVLLESNNDVIQRAVLANNWGGEILATDSDYLMVNNANITDQTQIKENIKDSGAKTSLSVKESIDYKVENGLEGLTGDLTVTRSHNGDYEWPDGININYSKILVPQGSVLVKAELNGQDITEKIEVGDEAGKTTFSTWVNTAPQTSNVLNLVYKLPISNINYHLLAESQPGNTGDELNVIYGSKVLFNGLFDRDKTIR